MVITAGHLCADELFMSESDFEKHSNLIVKIAEHFNFIMNLPKDEI